MPKTENPRYRERVYAIVRRIPSGRVMTYGQIAELLGLWSNGRRTSRDVKRIAQQHLAALEEKMREMAEMQAALERLVVSCHGDEDPQCAILDQLSVDSPAGGPTTITARIPCAS